MLNEIITLALSLGALTIGAGALFLLILGAIDIYSYIQEEREDKQ